LVQAAAPIHHERPDVACCHSRVAGGDGCLSGAGVLGIVDAIGTREPRMGCIGAASYALRNDVRDFRFIAVMALATRDSPSGEVSLCRWGCVVAGNRDTSSYNDGRAANGGDYGNAVPGSGLGARGGVRPCRQGRLMRSMDGIHACTVVVALAPITGVRGILSTTSFSNWVESIFTSDCQAGCNRCTTRFRATGIRPCWQLIESDLRKWALAPPVNRGLPPLPSLDAYAVDR
jgi:hypothetical protein